MIEEYLRQLLLTFSAVTALVGTRIRPDTLGQQDSLPAIIVDVREIVPQNTLDGEGGLARATVHIEAVSTLKAEARAVMEAVRVNGTEPGTGLAGFSGAAGDGSIDAAVLDATQMEYRPFEEGGDSGWHIVRGVYSIWYQETT